ncbi:MAG: thioesterase II family protein, partial [Spirulinaceae cyanobacterium]
IPAVEPPTTASPATHWSATDWLINLKPNPTATCRLFCFPYNSGSIAAFYAWPEALPETVEVYGIQLPGGADRRHEEPPSCIAAVVKALAPLLLPYLDRPFAFYGHSLGALIAFEMAQAIYQQTGRSPAHLLVGSWGAPHLPHPYPNLQHHSDREIITQILPLVDVPEAVLSNADTMRSLLPLLKAGARLYEDYQYPPRAPLNCPITAFGGAEDRMITPDLLRGWQQQTHGPFQLRILPGNHLFLHSAESILMENLTECLTRAIAINGSAKSYSSGQKC